MTVCFDACNNCKMNSRITFLSFQIMIFRFHYRYWCISRILHVNDD